MKSKYSEKSNVPLALAVFLATDYYDKQSDDVISVTTLIKPVRQIILRNRVNKLDISSENSDINTQIPLSNMMASRIGTAVHDGIERAWRDNYQQAMQELGYPDNVINKIAINPIDVTNVIPIYLEQRTNKAIGKYTISGKFDFISEGVVQDFKTSSVYAYKYQSSNASYKAQGSIYRWLNPKIITKDELHIHYIFKDWSSKSATNDPTYPQAPFITQKIPMMSIQETEQYIIDKLIQIEKFIDAADADIPLCSDEDLWRTEPVFKYYKNPLKTQRSTANFDNKQDAFIRLNQDGSVGIVKEIPGEVKACKTCPALGICEQALALAFKGDLKF